MERPVWVKSYRSPIHPSRPDTIDISFVNISDFSNTIYSCFPLLQSTWCGRNTCAYFMPHYLVSHKLLKSSILNLSLSIHKHPLDTSNNLFKDEWIHEKISKSGDALKITQDSHILCYDVASFRKVQNWIGAHYKSSLENGYVCSQAFSREIISLKWVISFELVDPYLSLWLSAPFIQRKEEFGRDPKGWINVRNQFWTPFSSPSVADYFYFSLNRSHDRVKFQFHCSWWYTTSASRS